MVMVRLWSWFGDGPGGPAHHDRRPAQPAHIKAASPHSPRRGRYVNSLRGSKFFSPARRPWGRRRIHKTRPPTAINMPHSGAETCFASSLAFRSAAVLPDARGQKSEVRLDRLRLLSRLSQRNGLASRFPKPLPGSKPNPDKGGKTGFASGPGSRLSVLASRSHSNPIPSAKTPSPSITFVSPVSFTTVARRRKRIFQVGRPSRLSS